MNRKRIEALQRLKNSLTQQQVDDLQFVIKNTEHEGNYSGCDSDGGSFWEESVSDTLSALARELDFKDDAFDL